MQPSQEKPFHPDSSPHRLILFLPGSPTTIKASNQSRAAGDDAHNSEPFYPLAQVITESYIKEPVDMSNLTKTDLLQLIAIFVDPRVPRPSRGISGSCVRQEQTTTRDIGPLYPTDSQRSPPLWTHYRIIKRSVQQ